MNDRHEICGVLWRGGDQTFLREASLFGSINLTNPHFGCRWRVMLWAGQSGSQPTPDQPHLRAENMELDVRSWLDLEGMQWKVEDEEGAMFEEFWWFFTDSNMSLGKRRERFFDFEWRAMLEGMKMLVKCTIEFEGIDVRWSKATDAPADANGMLNIIEKMISLEHLRCTETESGCYQLVPTDM